MSLGLQQALAIGLLLFFALWPLWLPPLMNKIMGPRPPRR